MIDADRLISSPEPLAGVPTASLSAAHDTLLALAELCELLTKHRGHLDDGLYVHSFDRGDRLPVKKSFGPLCMAAINCMWQLIHSREQCYLVRWYREA